MPKSVYQCVYCGKVYDTKTEASACEKEHTYVSEIIKYNYGEEYDRKIRYPSSIMCKMSDGKEIKFYRKESAIR